MFSLGLIRHTSRRRHYLGTMWKETVTSTHGCLPPTEHDAGSTSCTTLAPVPPRFKAMVRIHRHIGTARIGRTAPCRRSKPRNDFLDVITAQPKHPLPSARTRTRSTKMSDCRASLCVPHTCIHTSPSEITNYKHAIFPALIIQVVKKYHQGFKPSVT
jgi:hypothetical protein